MIASCRSEERDTRAVHNPDIPNLLNQTIITLLSPPQFLEHPYPLHLEYLYFLCHLIGRHLDHNHLKNLFHKYAEKDFHVMSYSFPTQKRQINPSKRDAEKQSQLVSSL